MIKSIEARYFRKHEDLKINFTKGLNVLRGPNEIGKTTVTEIILYSFYGAASLVDKLEEVVTWGQKDSALKVKTVVSITGVDYTFTRSKAGAEVNYMADGKPVKVTGQKEVTAFAAALLGADAKTASVLMLSSQAGLRGALDEGATAVGALMGKLADFDTIDKLLQNASATLSLGSIVPVQEKLAAADLEVQAAKDALVDPAALQALDLEVTQISVKHIAEKGQLEKLVEVMTKADLARDEATSNNNAVDAAARRVAEVETALRLEIGRLNVALEDAKQRPTTRAIDEARTALAVAKSHDTHARAYQAFTALPAYPAVAWDDTKESFDIALAEAIEQRDGATGVVREMSAEINAERRNLLSPGTACKSCGHKSDDPAHMAEHNAAVNARIAALETKLAEATKVVQKAVAEVADLAGVQKTAALLHGKYDALRDYLTYDKSVYPWKATWSGAVPGVAPDLGKLKAAIDTLELQERQAVQAEGRAVAHRATIAEYETALERAKSVERALTRIDPAPLQAAYEVAYTAYNAQETLVRELGWQLDNLKDQRAEAERLVTSAKARLEQAQARVAEYVADIKTLEFNNELVKKLKSMKPLITDFLWNRVLAAVGNYFSVLRGEQSIVTKDAAGFKVNGRGGSLSGSTLDMLALAIRVALSKTFVPHANFMVLDEPAHGCDNLRASALLGFLSGVGFEQTILASHDELSESVADHVINLGS